MKRRLLLLGLVGLVLIVAAVVYWKLRAAQQQALVVPTAENKLLAAVASPPPVKIAPVEPQAEAVYATSTDYDARELAPSLADVTITAKLIADADGNLILGPEVRDFFDYFLNTLGEATPEQIAAEVRRFAETHLPAQAVEQTLRLFAQYSTYKAAAVELMVSAPVTAEPADQEAYIRALEESFQKLRALRRQYLAPQVADALFGLEELYSDYTFDYLRIQADPLLTESQRASLIALRRQALPEVIRKSEEQAEAESRQAAEVYAAIEQAQDELEVRALLARFAYPPGQVEDVVRAFREQRDFNRKYAQYQQQVAAIRAQAESAEAQARQIEAVRAGLFVTESERLMAQLRDLNESADSPPLLPAN